eukprot:15460191-Alexandrium_andersonii.AAC.1
MCRQVAVGRFSLPPTGPSDKTLLQTAAARCLSGGATASPDPPVGASGASGRTGGAIAPPDPPKSASGAAKAHPP